MLHFQAGILALPLMQKYRPVSFHLLDPSSVATFPASTAMAPVRLPPFPHTSRFPRTALSFLLRFLRLRY
jgi:hypothetical protein